MQSVTSADGTRIAYERHGDGQPLVLVHGGSKPDYWMPVVPHLAEDYRVVVPHRRGHGESGDGDEYSLRREVEDIAAVLDDVDGDPVLFGHSFGGLVALETARVTAVDRLVAYEPGVLVGEYRERADLAAKMQAELDDGDPVEATKVYVREVIHGGDIDDLDAWLAEWPPWPGLADIAENLTRMNHAIEAYELPETLDVEAPTLLLTGTDGPPHLRESVREVHAALPESRLVEFDGVSHSGPVEAPEAVLGAVRGFVEERQTPPSATE